MTAYAVERPRQDANAQFFSNSTPFWHPPNGNFMLRLVVAETAGSNQNETPNFQIQWQANTGSGYGSWFPLRTFTSSNVASTGLIWYSDRGNLVNTLGSGTTRDTVFSANGSTSVMTATQGSDEYEMTFGVLIYTGGTPFSAGDQIQFRVLVDPTGGESFTTFTQSVVPRIVFRNYSTDWTVTESVEAYRFYDVDTANVATATPLASTNTNIEIAEGANTHFWLAVKMIGPRDESQNKLPGASWTPRFYVRVDTGTGFGNWEDVDDDGTGVSAQVGLSGNTTVQPKQMSSLT